MKKITLIIATLVTVFSVNAQNKEAYMKAMAGGLQKLGSATDVASMQAAAGQFERIAAKMDKDWYSNYYAGLSYTRMSMMAEGISTKDEYSKKALEFAKKAKDISPNNSEVVALEGFVYMAQLAADPNTRGQMLSGKVMQNYGEALRLNPENPRALALLAQMRYGTALFFGSSTAEACGMAKNSLPIFESEEKGQSFNPTWGVEMANGLISQCEK